MKLEKIKGFLSLSRLTNCFISFFSVLIIVLFISRISDVSILSILFKTILGALSVFLITAGGNAVNDYYDIKTDKINKPDRPIPSKIITKKEALYFTSIVFFIGLVFSFFVNTYAFFIALFNIFILIAYSKLKQKTLFGNFIVAYLCGSVFLYTGTILMINFKLFIIFFLLAFLLMLGREIT
ncbi:MAG: UbiA family prenyltransferase, partial [Candidatus Aenigmarchaeota archaeon]|nr:UbiA family prenyltransferase [Candidatus Aenigmarchaeota archaeon]